MAAQVIPEIRNRSKFSEIFDQRFKESIVFDRIFKGTIRSANISYIMAIVLNVLMFLVGVSLIVAAIYLAFINNDRILPIVFTGFGTTSTIILLLSRPIERIQTAVNNLIQSQIACLSYQAQYEIIYGMMVLKFDLFDSKNREYIDEQLKCAKYLQELNSQIILDLSSIEGKKPKPKTNNEERY